MFSPSVNIIRDAGRALAYVPTPNAQTVFKQLVGNYRAGIHCFNVVGAYGTGKSSFLWAFEQTLNGQADYFALPPGGLGVSGFEVERLVGEYTSFRATLASRLALPATATTPAVLHALADRCAPLVVEGRGLLLLVDEFGKFLEYAARENPEEEPYFLQELAEFLNDPARPVLLLTTVHQDVSAYALGLTRPQRLEWEKVKGRLKELTFNEPVEQLLLLAATQLATRPATNEPPPAAATNERLFAAIKAARAFTLRDYFTPDMQWQLWPLDLLSASVLVQALQQYGQNERSLFSFLSAHDHLGLDDPRPLGTYYGVSRVYDYLSFHFYTLLTSRHNPQAAQWATLRHVLAQLDKYLDDPAELDAAQQLVKTLGLLMLFAPAGAELTADFLDEYAQTALGLPGIRPLLTVLERHRLVRFRAHRNSYILFGGTDVDIEAEVENAGAFVEPITDVAARLSEFFPFPYVVAKQVSFAVGTPRVFEIRMTTDVPLLEVPIGEVDGFVNLIFSETLTRPDLLAAVDERHEAVLYGLYRHAGPIRRLLHELDKVRYVRHAHLDDEVAVGELDNMLDHAAAELRQYVLGSFYAADGAIEWVVAGRTEAPIFQGRRSFNRRLSALAADVYHATPVYHSELANRSRWRTSRIKRRSLAA